MRRLSLLLLCFCSAVSAKDLGTFGETFEIEERDLLEHITSKLHALQNSGQLAQEKTKIEARIKEHILHPSAVERVTHTQKKREFQFDPTITVTRDLSDHNGKIFARKGDQFNPLKQLQWSKTLLFIDGEDEKQVQWAITKLQKNNLCKIILVKGAPLDIQKRLRRDIYFDQHGFLTHKLGIQHVPAIVFQKRGEHVLTIIEEKSDDA
ncbi:MAG: type-F conjugative transfer system protein TraW [Alphaproteobacteria bacterium]|nr:type-F conjugative transfer system protein TraW [Alphaproteobacteria bacterium]